MAWHLAAWKYLGALAMEHHGLGNFWVRRRTFEGTFGACNNTCHIFYSYAVEHLDSDHPGDAIFYNKAISVVK